MTNYMNGRLFVDATANRPLLTLVAVVLYTTALRLTR